MPALDPPFEFQDPVLNRVVVVCCNFSNDRAGLGFFLLSGDDLDFEMGRLDLIALVEALGEIAEKKTTTLEFESPDGGAATIAKLHAEENFIAVNLTAPESAGVQSMTFAISHPDAEALVDFLQPAL